MHTVSHPSSDVQTDPSDYTARSSGCPDELSPAFIAEMNAAFPWTAPSDAEIDAMYEAEMIRRDAEAAAKAAVRIVQCVEPRGRKFLAIIEVNGKKEKLGTFDVEGKAWGALDARSRAIRANVIPAA